MLLDEVLEEVEPFIGHAAAYDWMGDKRRLLIEKALNLQIKYPPPAGSWMAAAFCAASADMYMREFVARREKGEL